MVRLPRFALISSCLLALACGDDDLDPAVDAGPELLPDAAEPVDAFDPPLDEGPPPVDLGPERVPVFVASGDGGWLAVSCDRGRSWTATERSAERGDHTEWTGFGGIASGNETFVAAYGWGAAGHVLTSVDGGASWAEPEAAQFETAGGSALRSGAAAVVFDGSEFLLFTRGIWASTDGLAWAQVERRLPPSTHQTRQLRGFPEEGVLVLSGEAQRENEDRPVGNFVALSEDGGETWIEGTGYDSACSHPIQHRGDIEMMGDTVLVGATELCRSTDRAATWEVVEAPSSTQDLYRTEDAFYLVGRGDSQLYRSEDGLTWTATGDMGVSPGRATYGDGVHVVYGTADGAQVFAYSDDGETFERAAFETDLEPTGARDITFGWAPSSTCD